MVTDDELESIGVFPYETYSNSLDLKDILIGNGFSINLCNRLRYNSLCDLFSNSASAEILAMFKEFNTTNFEVLLEGLSNAQIVNKVLNNQQPVLSKLKEELKNGLISTIQATHPRASEINDHLLRSLAFELSEFDDIYTTNYDVFLYKIILANNSLVERSLEDFEEFADGFYEDHSTGKLAFDDFDYKPRNLIYLHGALFFFDPNGVTVKLTRLDDGVEYIKLIKQYLDNDEFPVYVAEGNSDSKLEAINNNYYLRMAYSRFKNRDGNLATYGFSFSKSDKHIIGAINMSTTKNIIASIYPKSTLIETQKEMSRISNLFPNIAVSFFNYASLFNFKDPVKYYI
ncbi:DUF4917 family protein [Pedobacter sp. Hv1]|uniref:DUF4917 family protein n=1 Tax=Pedobacter sp. Hv1 TaxID=1740090 RepID=UPI0006D8CD74|nr:DUF4917 family protein [Pedobacter sp. Hv1]KQC01850.1 hypothetical protein AQF98_05660 [Pedobacter sp. Hv1]